VTNSQNRLDPAFWEALAPLKAVQEYAAGNTIFERGKPAQGIYFVEQGRVKILLDGAAGNLFEVAGPGSVLGLTESVAGNCYKSTVEAVDCTRVGFVKRSDLLDFLRGHCDVCMQVVQLLSEDLHVLYHEFRSMDLPGARHRKKSLREAN
jgi:CRP/FNR family transcriptional regulator, cyclic AMP receptor protein